MRTLAIFGGFMMALTTADVAYDVWAGYSGHVIEPRNSIAYVFARALSGHD